MKDIKKYIEPYLTFDEPVPYKDCLNIYEIKVKNWFSFMSAYDILNIEKNKIPDVQVMQMSYLEFLFQLMITAETNEIRDKFIIILGLCFGVEYDEKLLNEEFSPNEILYSPSDGDVVEFSINGYDAKFISKDNRMFLNIKGVEINSTEFDDIKRIIMFQNFMDYDDEPMSDDFRNIIQQYYALKNKGVKQPTLEQKMVALMSQLKYTKSEIKDMGYRTFNLILSSILDEQNYFILKIAQTQGYDKEVEHWLYKKDKQKYSEAFGDAQAFENKIKSI